jgi:aminocarboxymuconate-semialdehyde decarboxylase
VIHPQTEDDAMPTRRTIDVHAHVLSEDTMRLMRHEAPSAGPRLTEVTAEGGALDVAGAVYKTFPRGAWDLDKRLEDMDEHGVDVQVVSIVPQTFLYDQEPALAGALASIQNEQIAGLVRSRPDRFMGLATLPMQDPDRAADELRRAMRTLGLRGAMIGSHIEGRNLDDPALEPVWAAASELGAFFLIHPQKPAGGKRLDAYYLKNLIGNPLETTIAAACLVFGGVMERHPNLTICLSHAGGFVPYQTGRFIHGWAVRTEPKQHLAHSPEASLGRFFFDTILHAQEMLQALISVVGASRVLLGSDYPFDMGQLDCVALVRSLDIPPRDRQTILQDGAELLLGAGGIEGKRSAKRVRP